MDAASTELNLIGLYSDYIDWAVTGTNLKYFFAFSSAGGRVIDSGAGTSIPDYYYLENGWRIAPDEADHTLTVKTVLSLLQAEAIHLSTPLVLTRFVLTTNNLYKLLL